MQTDPSIHPSIYKCRLPRWSIDASLALSLLDHLALLSAATDLDKTNLDRASPLSKVVRLLVSFRSLARSPQTWLCDLKSLCVDQPIPPPRPIRTVPSPALVAAADGSPALVSNSLPPISSRPAFRIVPFPRTVWSAQSLAVVYQYPTQTGAYDHFINITDLERPSTTMISRISISSRVALIHFIS